MARWRNSGERWRSIRAMPRTSTIAGWRWRNWGRWRRRGRTSGARWNSIPASRRRGRISAKLLSVEGTGGRRDLNIGADVLPVGKLDHGQFGGERRGDVFGLEGLEVGGEGESTGGLLFRFLSAAPHGHVALQSVDFGSAVIGDHEVHHELF